MNYNIKETIQLNVKPMKNRGAIWREDEIHKLLQVWSQPVIFNGFLNETRKTDIFIRMSKDLNEYGVYRRWEECRAKVKNLKADFRRCRESGSPETFKYFDIMDKILSATTAAKSGVELKNVFGLGSSCTSSRDKNQPVQIEFEIMPSSEHEHEYQEIQTAPIQNNEDVYLLNDGSGYNKVEIGADMDTNEMSEGTNNSTDELLCEYVQVIETDPLEGLPSDNDDGTPIIINSSSIQSPLSTLNMPSSSSSNIQGATGVLNSQSRLLGSCNNGNTVNIVHTKKPISNKRRKLQSISEKMAETVDRILTQTTNSLIEEIKASEERYISWEEKKRLEDQKREEKLFQNLINAIRNKSQPVESQEHDGRKPQNFCRKDHERQRLKEMISSAEDPCAMTFDLLATKLANQLQEQQKETEHTLLQWETKMQQKEMKHTDNLFNMIISAVRPQDSDDFN